MNRMQILRRAALSLPLSLSMLAAGTMLCHAETIILQGARVLTMEAEDRGDTAIAIVDGRIAAVGSPDAMQPFSKGATTYDLDPGTLVLPSFRDSHTHLIYGGAEAQDVSLAGVKDDAGVVSAFEAAGVASLPKDAWVRGGGWDIAALPGVDAALLDAATGSRPAYVSSSDGHSAWVSSAALKAAGITADSKDPEGGRIERDAKGRPTGLLRENAMYLVYNILPPYPRAQVDRGLAKAQDDALSFGISSIIDPAAEEWMLEGYQRADRAGKLKLRVEAAVQVDPAKGAADIPRILDLRKRYASPRLKVTSAKLFVDGVVETRTAALLDNYVDSETRGDLLFTEDSLKQVAIAADAAGLQLHAHAIGDRAVRATLDAYEAAAKANGPGDHRHQITHLELVDPADIPRFKSLGVIANIQALWAYPEPWIVDLTMPKIGPERSAWLYPFGALAKGGAMLVGSSDWGVSSMNPLEAIQTAVLRQDITRSDGPVLNAEQRVDLITMLRAYTIKGAYAAFDEAQSGTLAVGKRADIIILDRDVTRGKLTDIARARVLATFIDGEPVYRHAELPKPHKP